MPDDRDASVEQTAKEAREELGQIQDDFEDKLKALEKRATEAKRQHEKTKARVEAQRADDGKAAKGLGIGLTVAYAIIGTPLVGFGAGWALDQTLGTRGWQSGLGLLGAFLGVGYAVFVLNKFQQD